MKQSDWKIFISASAYTLLFFKQEPGLNFLLFSVVMVTLAMLQNFENLKMPSWIAVSIGVLFSGFFVFYYGTNLPITANIISLIFLAGITFNAKSSLIISAFNSFTSYILAIPLLIYRFIKSKTKKDVKTEIKVEKITFFKKIMLLLFPLFVVFVFFVLYRDSNPLFLKITEDINLDWLSARLVKTFLSALLMMYAFFIQNIIKPINNLDEKLKDDIAKIDEEQHKKSFFTKFLSLESEIFTGTALFVLLNLLILFLNGIDFHYLWRENPLPQGLVFSQYLHNGTFSLILSIVLAVFIIMFFFRGLLNFSEKGKWIKILGYIWIIQNGIMIISAMLRNKMYIAEYSMTHKRIGVYVFLTLAVIGLIVTFSKIALKKNTWYLIRKNTWAFYFVLIVSTAFDWDMIITNYNIDNANVNFIVDLDKNYLDRLSHSNTSVLANIKSQEEQDLSSIYFNTNVSRYNISFLQQKIQKLLDYNNRKNWQETCLNKNYNIQKLNKLNDMGKIAKLDLYSNYLEEIPQYSTLSNIQGLDFSNNNLKNNLKGLSLYKNLEVLNLNSNQIQILDSLPNLENLEYLNLSQNSIKDYSELGEKTINLSHLDISNLLTEFDEENFPLLPKLQSINLSQSYFESWNFLSKQTNLKEIIYTNSSYFDIQITNIESLEGINLSESNNTYLDYFLDSLSVCRNLKEMNLANSKIMNINILLNNNKTKALFPKLEYLNLSGNILETEIEKIHLMKNLKQLNLKGNSLTEIEALKYLYNIERLNISNNNIKNVIALSSLEKLEYLNVQTNKIETLNKIVEIKNLQNLDISNNRLKSIDSIIKLKETLEVLDISNNKIKDISMLKEMKKLKKLYIDGNQIEDFNVLFEMENLEYVSIGNIDLETIEELKIALPRLEFNYYSNNLNKTITYNNNKRVEYVK